MMRLLRWLGGNLGSMALAIILAHGRRGHL
jgi:hypothetical protein